MANGTFTVYLHKSPNDRNPENLGTVKGSEETQVLARAVALARARYNRKEIFGCGIEAIEYTGERRQFAGVVF